jgi:hypothetical protein
MRLSQTAARALALAAQGLLQPPTQPATKDDLLAAIGRMGALQIDTIHVVARSPYLVLWSRLGAFEQRWLTELLAERQLFEYWSHEACFLPAEDYPLYRRLMLDGLARQWRFVDRWSAEHAEQRAAMLAHIREHGPVRSSDFERTDGQPGGWWNWKLEKMTLEMLYTTGELMIAGRHNFQRIYDLRERVLPEWEDALTPSLDEVRRELALKAVRALGIAKAAWLGDYFRTDKKATVAAARALLAEGRLVVVDVEGWDEPALVHPENLALAEQAAAGALEPTHTTLLSPFDPLVWDRRRALELFGFEYRIECYTPAPKRRYGYFTLPILHRGELIGRLDPKAHRAQGLFEVKALYLEPGVPPTEALAEAVGAALQAFAAWHATPTVVVRQCDPPEFGKAVELSANTG